MKSTYFILLIAFILVGTTLCSAQGTSVRKTVEFDKPRGLDSLKKSRLTSSRVMLDVGFGHWVSDRFRTAVLGKDLGFGITVNPGFRFIQLQARYDYSKIRTTETDTIYGNLNGRHIGFTAINMNLCNDFGRGVHEVIVSYGGGLVLVDITGRPVVPGVGGGFGVYYLIKNKSWKRLGMGISVNVQSRTYNISGNKAPLSEWVSADKVNLDRDLNVIFGYVISL